MESEAFTEPASESGPVQNDDDFFKVWEFRQNEDLVKKLVTESDNCVLCCQHFSLPIDCVRIQIKNPNVEDKLGGWLEPGVVKANKKKKTRRRSAEDALYMSFNDYESHNEQRASIKSADDVWVNGQAKKPLPFWKSVVETDTYRYIPSNGRYRLEKTAAKMTPIRQKKPERVYLTSEQRALQREIQRDLRKELDQRTTDSIDMVASINQLGDNMINGPIKLQYSHGENKKPNENSLEAETNFYGRSKQARLQGLSQSFAPSLELPPITNQAMNYLDPFMEQVSKKLSALEKEIEHDNSYRMSSRKSMDHDRDDHSVTNNKTGTKSDRKNNNKIDAKTPDMFSVKQLIRNNEKKLNAKSIQIQKSGDPGKDYFALPSHVKYTTANGDVISIPLFSNVHAPNTTSLIDQERQHFRNGLDGNGNNSLENTLQTTKCKVKKDQGTSQSKRKHAGSGDGPKAISNAFPRVQLGQSRGDQLSSKNLTAEDSYTDLLPKISGKRLEVPLTMNRF